MGLGLAQHMTLLLEEKAEEFSIVSDNHTSHERPNGTRQPSQETEGEGEESDDIVTELYSQRPFAGMSFNIVSDNPRSHVRTAAKKSVSTNHRLVHSSSAPALQFGFRHHSTLPNARWGTAGSESPNQRLRSVGLGSMKIPSRPRGDSIDHQSSRQNASWDSKPSQLKGTASMDKKRLQSLGLGSFASPAKKVSGACRWSIPKRGSDSALIYPRRPRDL